VVIAFKYGRLCKRVSDRLPPSKMAPERVSSRWRSSKEFEPLTPIDYLRGTLLIFRSHKPALTGMR
jgi:hypothetical protein